MHEIGICYEIVRQLRDIMKVNNLTEVSEIVLSIGKAHSVVPKYMIDSWPVAIDETEFANTKMTVEEVTAIGKCRKCGHNFDIKAKDRICPFCGASDWDVIMGKDFFIKEIKAC